VHYAVLELLGVKTCSSTS